MGCGEGGCGACTVHITRTVGGKPVRTMANACLRPVLSLDGAAVVTTEGLMQPGSEGIWQASTLHPIQQELADCDGSQCGYCSPGMVMAMYGLLTDKADAKTKPTLREVEERFQGNICRCTGYRPILDAFKSVADGGEPQDSPRASVCRPRPLLYSVSDRQNP